MNGVPVDFDQEEGVGTTQLAAATGIVPPGANYRVTSNGGCGVSRWSELR